MMQKIFEWKFIVTLVVVLAASILCGMGRIDGTVYAAILVPVIGAFLAADVTQAVLTRMGRRHTMTPQEIARSLASLTPGQLGGMDHASLYSARQHVPSQQQDLISPYEHRAFAREATQENPLMALPIAAGTLAYQPYKMLTGQSRSGASLDQIGQGLTGVGEGLWAAFQDRMNSISSRTTGTGKETSAIGLLESLRHYSQGSSTANTNRR